MSRGRPFEPGNKFGRGRPKGSKNKSTSPGRRLLEEYEETLMRKNIAEALKGDTKVPAVVLERVEFGQTPRASKLKMPPIKTLDDIATALDVVLNEVANHKCTDAHGQVLCAMLAETT